MTATKQKIAVAIYARASSDEQTVSCGDQLKVLRVEAKKRGYTITGEYVDDGLSGSKNTTKRVAFHQMIADSTKREFTRVMVFDMSRFGRLDSLTGASHKLTLRQNGVEGVISLGEGEINWTSGMGRMMDTMMSEANYETALKISKSSIRGRVEQLIERKVYPHGGIPFGYSKVYKGDGQEIKLPRTARFQKPKKWVRELVINEAEAAVVRRIYDHYLNQAQSVRQITARLNAEKVPAWGAKWSWNSVIKILTSKCYLGYGCIHDQRKLCSEAHNRCEKVEVPNVIPAITDLATWEAVQRLRSKSTISRFRSDKDNRTLSGIVRCGHCGYALVSRQRVVRKGRTGRVYYSCIGGLKYNTPCPQWQVYESDILPGVIRELVKVVDAEVIASMTPQESSPNDPTAAIQNEIEKLKEHVKRATLRAATADDDMLAEYDEAARELRNQLKAAEERLKVHRHIESEGGPSLWSSWWAEVRPGLVLASDDPVLAEELAEAAKRHPALAKVKGGGGFDEWQDEARKALVRVARDGKTDPLLSVLPELLEGESQGVLMDSNTLKATLRKLGCEVAVYWRKSTQKLPLRWEIDKAQVKVTWACHTATTCS